VIKKEVVADPKTGKPKFVNEVQTDKLVFGREDARVLGVIVSKLVYDCLDELETIGTTEDGEAVEEWNAPLLKLAIEGRIFQLHEDVAALGERFKLPESWGTLEFEIVEGKDEMTVDFPDGMMGAPERHVFPVAKRVSYPRAKLPTIEAPAHSGRVPKLLAIGGPRKYLFDLHRS